MACFVENNQQSSTSGYLKLINLVRQYPVLYSNVNDVILDTTRFRSNQKEANRCWLEIASQLGISAGECRKRWKNLREVFTNIQKRRVQESLNDSPKKKWIYEDAMSFLNLKNEELNEQDQKDVMENFNESEIDNQEVVEHYVEEMDGRTIQMESQDEQIDEGTVEYLELDIDSIDDSEEYYVVNNLTPQKQPKMDVESTILLKSNQIVIDDKSLPKYVTICSKIDPNCSQSETAVINVAEIDSENGYFITAPVIAKEELSENIILESQDKKTSEQSEVQTSSIKSIKSEGRVQTFPVKKNRRKIRNKELFRTSESSIEEFFENMVQTVLKLPTQAQAEVKMEICKIVTMAEIRLSSQNSKKY